MSNKTNQCTAGSAICQVILNKSYETYDGGPMDFDIYARISRIPTILSVLESHGGVMTTWLPSYPGGDPPGMPETFPHWPHHILYVLKLTIVTPSKYNSDMRGRRRPISFEVNGQTVSLKNDKNEDPMINTALPKETNNSSVDLVVCHDPAQAARQCDMQCCNNTYTYKSGTLFMSCAYDTLHEVSDMNETDRNIRIHKYYTELYRMARYSANY